ncbi:tellurite resistance TerB family protein [Pistricoccus aurantiacus]|uniref:tellurite resistance TerB family protein n=1 Tax=Pistricoccus aurantiacus TaxID=1883414 RepID=UPI0036258548
MNAKGILEQLMKQAGGVQSGSQKSGGSGGFDPQQLLQGLASQLGGNKSSDASKSGGSGFDVKSLLGGGTLGMLMGSKRGRSMGGKAIKYGAIAGVGMLAWKAWQNYQADQPSPARQSDVSLEENQQAAPSSEGRPLEQLDSDQAKEQRSLEILQAMIMAARADGHIDDAERAQLAEHIESMGADDELQAWVEEQFKAPLDAQALARQADSPQAAREIYLVSVAMIDEQNPMERAWLDQLAEALKLEPKMIKELEHQVHASEQA